MNKVNRLFIFFFLTALSLTQSQNVAARTETGDIQFYPVRNWTFLSAPKSADGITVQYCALQTEFDNGFSIQFEGSHNWVETLVIDFHQDVFKAGEQYSASLAVKNERQSSIVAEAVSASLLMLDIAAYPDLYDKLRKTPVLDFALDSNRFEFHMTGLEDKAPDFEQCMAEAVPTGIESLPEITQTETVLASESYPDDNMIPMPEETPAPSSAPAQPQTKKSVVPKKDFVVNKERMDVTADFTDLDNVEPASASPTQSTVKRRSRTQTPLSGNENSSELKQRLAALAEENEALNEELMMALKESEAERMSITSENWDLERATMRYNEAERQLKKLGRQLQQERAQCSVEKRELEAMLFDPTLTDEKQMASLAELEDKLAAAQNELQRQRAHYEAQIQTLKNRGY